MIISIDTEKMNEMAMLAQSVNSELDMCSSFLHSIVEHNDWNCKERDIINDGILSVKKNAATLKETLDDFSLVLKRVAGLFDTFEASIPNQYQYIDSLLGTSYAVACEKTSMLTGDIASDITTEMAQTVRVSGGLENNVLGNLDKPIQMCNFEDLDFGK